MCCRTEPRRRRGFTLVEALVTLVIVTVVILGLLTLLDSSNRLAKQETQVADAQGSGRSAIYEVTRLVRQARVGYLSPLSSVMPWVNNATTETIDAGGTTHTLRPGTDALEVRGVLFGDSYFFNPGDVVCAGGPCNGSSTASVTIQALTATGYQNFPQTLLPELATRTRPFYFVISDTSFQTVAAGAASAPYAIPRYYVGRVDANAAGTWYTHNSAATPATFRFNVVFGDANAQELNATADLAGTFERPFSGGAVDDVVLFVDRGPQDPAALGGGYTHPFLAQAVQLGDGTWEVQRLVDDVEDLQFALGIDGADGSVPDRGVDPAVVTTDAGTDEWVGNVKDEIKGLEDEADTDPRRFDGFLDATVPTNPLEPATATPALRSVYVGIVTKSLDPDPRFTGPGARGITIFDSTAGPVSNQPYRRRAQTMAVHMRNYT